jgi:hypothetical protein
MVWTGPIQANPGEWNATCHVGCEGSDALNEYCIGSPITRLWTGPGRD